MHGCGNDFILIDNISEKVKEMDFPAIAQKLCDRKKGIGADGIIFMDEDSTCDIKMNFYNSDGSRGEMCGNGVRCLARFAYHVLNLPKLNILTDAGIVKTERIDEKKYKILLNNPSIEDHNCTLNYKGINYTGSYIELGEPGIPHFCLEFDFETVNRDELYKFAEFLRHNSRFSKGANINFFKLTGKNSIDELTYERGVEDFTLSCGTGTGCVAVSLFKNKLINSNTLNAKTPGGDLTIELEFESNNIKNIYLIGETEIVFHGNY